MREKLPALLHLSSFSLSVNFYNLMTIANSISAFFGRETASCPVIDEQRILKNYSYHFLLIPLNISVIYCGYRWCDLKPTEAGLFYTYIHNGASSPPKPTLCRCCVQHGHDGAGDALAPSSVQTRRDPNSFWRRSTLRHRCLLPCRPTGHRPSQKG